MKKQAIITIESMKKLPAIVMSITGGKNSKNQIGKITLYNFISFIYEILLYIILTSSLKSLALNTAFISDFLIEDSQLLYTDE